MTSICIEIKTECKHCGGSLTLNALVEEVLCQSCQKINDFPYEYWKQSILDSALNEYTKLGEGEGQNQTLMTGEYSFQIMYGLQKPRCGKCKTDLNPEHFSEYAGSGKTVCTKCSNEISVRVPQGEAKSAFEMIGYLIGEESDMFSTGKGAIKTPDAVKPILFTCPSCAGSLEIDGSDRVVACKFCNSQIYLPDDLWFRLHPVKTVERWYIVLDEKFVREKLINWYYLSDITIDKEGNLYLAGADDDQKFLLSSISPDFKTRWLRRDLEYGYDDTGLAVSNDRRLFVWNTDKHSLLILSADDGSTAGKLKGKEASAQEPEPFNLKGTHSLAIDRDGTLLVLKDDRILRFSADGRRLPAWPEAKENKKGFLSWLFGGGSGGSIGEDSSRDVVELKNKPVRVDAEYTFLACGADGYTYFMENTSSDDASVAKYDREGNKLWNVVVPLDSKSSRPYADENGNVYVLGKAGDKFNLIRLNCNTSKWETLLKDLREGGVLNEVEYLAVAADASRFYCLSSNNRMRVFDGKLNLVYISKQSKEDDEELLKEKKRKVESDEAFA